MGVKTKICSKCMGKTHSWYVGFAEDDKMSEEMLDHHISKCLEAACRKGAGLDEDMIPLGCRFRLEQVVLLPPDKRRFRL